MLTANDRVNVKNRLIRESPPPDQLHYDACRIQNEETNAFQRSPQLLKTTAAATASLAAFKGSLLWAAPATGVQGWTTSRDGRFEGIEPPQWRAATAKPFWKHSNRSRRPLSEGPGFFGAAFNEASCYWFAKLTSQERQSLLPTFLDPRVGSYRFAAQALDRATLPPVPIVSTTAPNPTRT
jgi:hypothetical protein